jgi:hypothetical protein
MARCLLFFSILRTRSARKTLIAGSVIVLLASLGGCDDDDGDPWWSALASRFAPRPTDKTEPREIRQEELGGRTRDELSRRTAQELAALEAEAGIERALDPAAPGGDLQRDLAEFTTLDACARSHRVIDPVLADAVDALGYDTLVRDACRILQALKARDVQLCQPIAAAPLRQRCESQVAVLAGQPALCPLVSVSSEVPAREPVCLARASRDERLCAAALGTDRAFCQALVRGRSSDCGNDGACVRQVERFRTLLEKPASHEPFAARLHIELASEPGQADRFERAYDLDDLAAGGAIARPVGDKVRFIVGAPKTALWPAWDSPSVAPRLFLALSVPIKPQSPPAERGDAGPAILLGPGDLAMDLLIPHIALLGGVMASDRRVTIDHASASTSSPLRLTLTTKVRDTARIFQVKIELETFVRDGVASRPAGK